MTFVISELLQKTIIKQLKYWYYYYINQMVIRRTYEKKINGKCNGTIDGR